ncbi:MAG: GTPase HflX [Candidatus Izemoplasmatales bacterium]|jgi:GTP-binding protein HflX|nr:GTPase HflX [Candidatus Izemoplasmatales bacterium]
MEKAILVGLDYRNDGYFEETMEELENLAIACDVEVQDKLIQKREAPTPNFFIGEGKISDLKKLINLYDADLVIFNDELSPSHIRNLEEKLDIKVIDRTVLILDIFAKRAKTKEAMLQVELAQSQYMLPRVVGMYKSLSRQKSGTGSKGPGEQQLELDRRILRDKITKLKRELKDLVKVRRTQRQKRNDSIVKTVALAGYTNSGKSTLMNAIIKHSQQPEKDEMFSKDMLFATLETKTRKIELENNNNFLLTDTVGFIRMLPHDLIEAFKSTLEEITEASLILHVIDVSNPNFPHQIEAVETVLKDLGVHDIPIIHVYNKIDLLTDIPVTTTQDSIFVSAKNDENIPRLLEEINRILYKIIEVSLIVPYDNGNVFSDLKENSKIMEAMYFEDGIHIKAIVNEYHYQKYKKFII